MRVTISDPNNSAAGIRADWRGTTEDSTEADARADYQIALLITETFAKTGASYDSKTGDFSWTYAGQGSADRMISKILGWLIESVDLAVAVELELDMVG